MKLDELFEAPDYICNSVENQLSAKMQKYGYTIENTLVTAIDPAHEVKNAMNHINASERLEEAAQNEADANYIKEVRKAEADRDRKRLQGEGISQQRIAILKGYEKGVGDMSKCLDISSADIIDFVMKTQHLDTLESIGKAPNSKTIFMSHQPEGNDSRKKENMIQAFENV